MAARAIPHADLVAVVTAAATYPSQVAAAAALGLNYGTFKGRLQLARAYGVTDAAPVVTPATPPPPAACQPADGFDEAWRVLSAQMGMREDKYAGPSVRPRSDRHVVMSDIHAPFHEPAYVAQAMADTADADTCIFAGDLGDGYGWSRFIKYESVPYEEEIAAVAAIVQMASERYRRVLIFDGNHDGPRLEKQLRERLTPEMVAAIQYMTGGTLSPIHALAKRFANVKIVGHVTPDGRRMGWLYQHGDVTLAHAEKYSVIPVAALRKIEEWLDDMKDHIGLKPYRVLIQGHTHAGGVTPWKADKLLVESGCLCKQHGYQLGARISGRPQRRGYVRFDQDSSGVTDINSVRFHWLDAELRRSA